MLIKNCMEDLVWNCYSSILRKYPDFCGCQTCVSDVLALALNNLPPKYIATHIGEVYTRVASLQQQFETDILCAVIKSIEIVQGRPRHDSELSV
jgi:competence protein ComFB